MKKQEKKPRKSGEFSRLCSQIYGGSLLLLLIGFLLFAILFTLMCLI